MMEQLQKETEKASAIEEVIQEERVRLDLDKKTIVSGIALSGGGIRSASFGLGVLQALVANNQLSKIDYMSTVSGGGYIGSALTWALKQGGKKAGTTPEKFPFGKRRLNSENNTKSDDNPFKKEDCSTSKQVCFG